jgi:phosphopantetheinyl transferase (holo-ACP synthase)
MIGNDIIDLQLAARQSNWKRKGFLDKLFSKQEQGLVFESSAPFRMVWKLWSMKESAYKIHVRKTGERRFNPRSFSCEIMDQKKGMVHSNAYSYVTRTVTQKELIHTMAHDKSFEEELIYGMTMNEDGGDPGAVLRQGLVRDLAERRKMPVDGLNVKKNGLQIPELYVYNRKLKDLCSLSHHGRYGAYLVTL